MVKKRYGAFTLMELLVVIVIISLLLALGFVGISKARRAAWKTDTANQLMTIQNAIQEYYSQFGAYPGPVPNSKIGSPGIANVGFGNAPPSPTSGSYDLTIPLHVTGTENLVLGLYGGLRLNGTSVYFDPAAVGTGPDSLNVLSPKKYQAFLSDTKMLSSHADASNGNKITGRYEDETGKANDSTIPEIVDKFPQGMPILYLRASKGALVTGTLNAQNNNVITDNNNTSNRVGQYQIEQVIDYTKYPIGEQRQLNKAKQRVGDGGNVHGLTQVDFDGSVEKNPPSGRTYHYPYDAYGYLVNTTMTNYNPPAPAVRIEVVKKKDEYVLISAGPDRIYGTEDDITNFGEVAP